jgi:glycosyltransferase involved in cell wall biosynthesis
VNVWIVSPAWRRFAVTRLVLAQRQRLCADLAARGMDAQMLIVADDENLEIATEYGAVALETPNLPLGRKCNAGLRRAGEEGADWIVWIGSDDWIHPDVFDPLPYQARNSVMLIGHRLGIVDLPRGRMTRCSSPSKYGAIPWIVPRKMLEPSGFAPVHDTSSSGLDGTLIRGIRRSRARLRWHYHNPHELRCVDFKSDTNITAYGRLTERLGIAPEQDAWPALAERYPADLVEMARRTQVELQDEGPAPRRHGQAPYGRGRARSSVLET